MRTLRLTAVLGVLLIAAACAAPSGASTGNNGVGETSSSVTPQPGGLQPAMRPNQLRPDSRAVALRRARWTRVEAAGRQLTVHFMTAGRRECNVLGRVDVVETARTITVTVLVGRLPNADCNGAQTQLAALNVTVVTLAEPLGRRHVRDGAAG